MLDPKSGGTVRYRGRVMDITDVLQFEPYFLAWDGKTYYTVNKALTDYYEVLS